eukprot:TRINITY_DN5013_c0_g1_i1.p1 TRINITY_DN5013_c0_g1~~TRINITY_DN5013_c0_g1_i1.p1  ORF type:complete len:503 (+),score=127.90 TRINITY_DN5013_c0_g1_i1:90-1598(+)
MARATSRVWIVWVGSLSLVFAIAGLLYFARDVTARPEVAQVEFESQPVRPAATVRQAARLHEADGVLPSTVDQIMDNSQHGRAEDRHMTEQNRDVSAYATARQATTVIKAPVGQTTTTVKPSPRPTVAQQQAARSSQAYRVTELRNTKLVDPTTRTRPVKLLYEPLTPQQRAAGCPEPPDKRDLSKHPIVIHARGKLSRPCPIPCVLTQSNRTTADGVFKAILGDSGAPAPRAKRPCPNQKVMLSSMESEINYPVVKQTRLKTNTFDLSSSYRRDSDVRVAYFSRNAIKWLRPPVLPKPPSAQAGALAVSFISNCGPRHRLDYISQLQQHIKVHNYGRCLHNVPESSRAVPKKDIFKTVKFSLGFENSLDYDYATEKLYEALSLGAVPVTLGPPNIHENVPHPHSYIDASKYTPKELAEYLTYLDHNDTAYAEFFAWKSQPMSESFERQLDETLLLTPCRMCMRMANVDMWEYIPDAKAIWLKQHPEYIGPGVLQALPLEGE